MLSARTGLALGLLAAGTATAAQMESTSDARVALKQRAEGDTPLLTDLGELCNRIGGRITGAPAADRAVSWAVDKLQVLGLDSVTTESYPMPFLWRPGSVEVAATAPEAFPLRAIAVPGTASTAVAIEAPVVDVCEGLTTDWAGAGAFRRTGSGAGPTLPACSTAGRGPTGEPP